MLILKLGRMGQAPPLTNNANMSEKPYFIDYDRKRRCGYPEVVYSEGKTTDALTQILHEYVERDIDGFATRLDAEKAAVLLKIFPHASYNALARTFRLFPEKHAERAANGLVAVISAGTSDQPVAEEAKETALWMGADVVYIQDIGVAGPHRLLESLPKFQHADAVVVVAGMEGALPSVVGGHVSCPVIAVPTSVGYGANFGGLAALLGMLNSCASNVTVVNIDAGFKGGYVAALIARQH